MLEISPKVKKGPFKIHFRLAQHSAAYLGAERIKFESSIEL